MAGALANRGVYCLGNDRVLMWLTAFLRSFRRHNPDTPALLIPFNDQIDKCHRLCNAYNVGIIEHDSLTKIDEIGKVFFPDQPVPYHMFRKQYAFWGEFDTFAYMDADIVVLDDIDPALTAFDESGAGIGYWESDITMVYLEGPFRDQMVREYNSPAINAGAFLGRKGIFTLEKFQAYAAEASPLAEHFNQMCLDQPFLNYCIDRERIPSVRMSHLLGRETRTWAGDPRVTQPLPGGRCSADPADKAWLPFLHWAGYSIHWHMPYRNLLLQNTDAFYRNRMILRRFWEKMGRAPGKVLRAPGALARKAAHALGQDRSTPPNP